MRKKKKNEDVLNLELNFNREIKIVRDILVSLSSIFILLDPILDKMLMMEEAEELYKNGTIDKAIQLFDDISSQCKKLANPSISPEIFKNLRN
ncbi:hypothetical protein LCGC14_1317790 [marine sediment metagenome]|uniref:Uncharacterized protein n=1 Tax=marine sediment metagenome TaxID=412755 RepID=A0A0F9N196_9ZZZZ